MSRQFSVPRCLVVFHRCMGTSCLSPDCNQEGGTGKKQPKRMLTLKEWLTIFV